MYLISLLPVFRIRYSVFSFLSCHEFDKLAVTRLLYCNILYSAFCDISGRIKFFRYREKKKRAVDT